MESDEAARSRVALPHEIPRMDHRIEPGPDASERPRDLILAERNAFLESLAPEAKERFLAALEDAAARGLSEQSAWEEAVVAAETTYEKP